MPTDTARIPIIHGDVACGWCRIKLAAIPDEPDRVHGTDYHPSCARAVRRLALVHAHQQRRAAHAHYHEGLTG